MDLVDLANRVIKYRAEDMIAAPEFSGDNTDMLKDFFLFAVAKERRHQHYTHTVELARRYKSYFTGIGQDDIVLSWKPNETDEQKTQRTRLYNSFTPHVAGAISDTYAAIESTDEMVDNIVYSGKKDASKQIETLLNATREFNNAGDVKNYLKTAFRRLSFYDPNAFVVVEFENWGNDRTNYTYPLEVTSDQVYDYKYRNGVLRYLIIELPITVVREKKALPGSRFIIYTDNYAMELRETSDGDNDGELVRFDTLKNRTFLLRTYETRAKQVQARRVGFLYDPSTDFQTCVSPLFKCDNLLKEIMIVKSERDIARACHGFIQKFAYAERCDYEYREEGKQYTEKCSNGILNISSRTCPSCKGTGKKIHTTSQDIIYIKLPDDDTRQIPLRDYVHYAQIPETILLGYDLDLDKLTAMAKASVFNNESFSRADVQTTATLDRIDLQWTYRAINVMANALCDMYRFIMVQSAIFNDLDSGLEINYQFPSSYNMENMDDMIAEVKEGTGVLPYECISALNQRIFARLNIDNPASIKRFAVKERHRPFKGLSESLIVMALADMATDNPDRVKYFNFDKLISRIETDRGPEVFNMDYNAFEKLLTEYAVKLANEGAPTAPAINNPLRDNAGQVSDN